MYSEDQAVDAQFFLPSFQTCFLVRKLSELQRSNIRQWERVFFAPERISSVEVTTVRLLIGLL